MNRYAARWRVPTASMSSGRRCAPSRSSARHTRDGVGSLEETSAPKWISTRRSRRARRPRDRRERGDRAGNEGLFVIAVTMPRAAVMSAGTGLGSLSEAMERVTCCLVVVMSPSPLEKVSSSSLGQSTSSRRFALSSPPFAVSFVRSNRWMNRFDRRDVGRARSSSGEALSSLRDARSSLRFDRKPVRASRKLVEADRKSNRASSITENVDGRDARDAGNPEPASRSSFPAAWTTLPACPTPERASLTAERASSPPLRFDRLSLPSNRTDRRASPTKRRSARPCNPHHRPFYPWGGRVLVFARSGVDRPLVSSCAAWSDTGLRTFLVVAGLALPDLLVEIEAVAVLD